MYKFGDVILAEVQFTDTLDVKTRPILVLFEESDNIVVAGITSNLKMKGISIKKEEGAIKDSIIKINYIFTISERMIKKYLFSISENKKKIIREEILYRLV